MYCSSMWSQPSIYNESFLSFSLSSYLLLLWLLWLPNERGLLISRANIHKAQKIVGAATKGAHNQSTVCRPQNLTF